MNLIAKIALEEFHEKCTLQNIRRQVKDMATGHTQPTAQEADNVRDTVILRIKETRHIMFSCLEEFQRRVKASAKTMLSDLICLFCASKMR